MSELSAVRCDGCGGAVAVTPGAPLPHCLFCGAAARDLKPYAPPEGIEPPEGALPFTVTAEQADSAFRAFATASIWYPSDLRRAKLELRHLLLPAWAWSGRLETHWAGLVSAATRSGKRPVAGAAMASFEQILVPASSTLTQAELRALGPYDEGALRSFDPRTTRDPRELSEMTRSAARQKAQDEMDARHAAQLRAEHGTSVLHTACVATNLVGRPVLVPVYIGAYRYGDGLYRILVNGQTGSLHGKAPISWWKVAGAVLAGVLLVLAVVGVVALCAGTGMLFSQV